MLAEALNYLAKLQTPKNPVTIEVRGEPYAVKVDGTIGEHIRKPDTTVTYPIIVVSTLSALVEIYKTVTDPKAVVIYVVDPFAVKIMDTKPDEFGNRQIYARAQHEAETDFPFDEFIDPESFIIKFRASFYWNEDAVKVQQLCSSLEAGSTVAVADDGISQTVRITAGTINKAPVTLPAEGVPLIPWRTFRDAAPVESKFLLRMKTQKEGLPRIALFAIDEKWKLDTVGSIRDYLRAQLPEATIIA